MAQFTNTLLNHLGPEITSRLDLHPVTFELGHEIEYPGRPIRHLFFLESGMASMTVSFLDGSQVEVGMFGFESVIGISALMGTRRSLNRIYTQIKGAGFSCPVAAASTEFELCGLFQMLSLRYVQTQLVQTMQAAGCNAKHEIEQRLSRWLLITSDRAHCETFALSQEFLANMLGCTRQTLSRVAATLKDEGLIDYSRGIVNIVDIARLERRSCECYRVIKNHLDNYAEFDTGFIA